VQTETGIPGHSRRVGVYPSVQEAERAMRDATVWTMLECPTSGARWTYANPAFADRVCTFSGCDCRKPVIVRGATIDRHEAHEWFRRPAGKGA